MRSRGLIFHTNARSRDLKFVTWLFHSLSVLMNDAAIDPKILCPLLLHLIKRQRKTKQNYTC